MKKKTLIILLIIPFIIGLLSFVSVILLNINVATNISRIDTPYNNDGEGFKVRDSAYLLEATPIVDDPNAILRDGNNLVWEIVDENEYKDIATITTSDNESFYLNTYSEGSITLSCHTENKGVEVRIKAIIYKDGAIIVTPKYQGSGESIEDTRYFGMYDISYDKLELDNITKNKANIEVNIDVYGDDISLDDVKVESTSSNISFNDNKIVINSYGEGIGEVNLIAGYIRSSYIFNIVKDGVNVYSYNDLLMCSNFSTDGEVIVMQTSLGSLREVYNGENIPISGDVGVSQGAYSYKPSLPLTKKDSSRNISLFGNYDEESNTFSFDSELYLKESSYNHKFLDDFNKNNPGNEVSTKVKVGIRVQKDFYGNGFSINMNNLCFPNNGSIDKTMRKLIPSNKDYFFGPLAYVTIGAPNVSPSIVKAYGEDNIGLLLDNDNITLNDLHIQNIDDNSNKRNYAYIGTVIDVKGKNNTIKNSIIKLGKTLIRAFDTDNLLIDNSILTRSGEFSLKVGSNEYLSQNEEQEINVDYDNQNYKFNYSDFYKLNSTNLGANVVLEDYLGLSEDSLNLPKEVLYDLLEIIQDYLNNTNGYINSDGSINYASNIRVNDTLFDDSGLFSIAFETMFNGPFLYNGLSSTVSKVMEMFNSPLPNKIGGTSKPINITLSGKTSFYDYKRIEDIDISNLIEENISGALGSLGEDVGSVTIDNFFPMKPILRDKAISNNYVFNYSGDEVNKKGEYLNTMVAYYGGGLNLSTLTYDDSLIKETKDLMSEEIIVDLLRESEKYLGGNAIATILARCVLFAAGFEPFKFITNKEFSGDTPYLFGEHPSVKTLRDNLGK